MWKQVNEFPTRTRDSAPREDVVEGVVMRQFSNGLVHLKGHLPTEVVIRGNATVAPAALVAALVVAAVCRSDLKVARRDKERPDSLKVELPGTLRPNALRPRSVQAPSKERGGERAQTKQRALVKCSKASAGMERELIVAAPSFFVLTGYVRGASKASCKGKA